MKKIYPDGTIIEWHADAVLNDAKSIVENLEKTTAKEIAAEAKARCPVWEGEERKIGRGDKTWKARKRGALRDSIRAEPSKYRDGGWLVLAGNYDVFYASFVELGTKSWWARRDGKEYPRRPLPEDPFLRNPLAKRSKQFLSELQDIFR